MRDFALADSEFRLEPRSSDPQSRVALPYELVLLTYSTTAWNYHKLGGEYATFDVLLAAVEKFAMDDYARALQAGSDLRSTERSAVAAKLHDFSGLPLDYILRADLRIDSGEFRQTLQGDR